jgi:hypothetical protein
MSTYLLERALVGAEVRDDVAVTVEDGRFTRVETGASDARTQAGEEKVPGLTLPGLANCHSHAFHRALRGRTQRGSGTFWTWREQMYATAERLDPDTYFELAVATYREMRCAGITAVGEFHYLRHQAGGTPYDEPNAMALALIEAAREAGIRITLLDAAYLRAGFGGVAVHPAQRHFFDADAEAWRVRSARLRGSDTAVAPRSTRSAPSRGSTWPRSPTSAPTPRCTSTSPSRSPRTRTASRRTASPRRSCSPTPACSARAPAPSTRPISPTPTSGCSAPATRTPASARPPSATSATASAPPDS